MKKVEKTIAGKGNHIKKGKCLKELLKVCNCCRIKYKGTRWERQKEYQIRNGLICYAKEPRLFILSVGHLEVVSRSN